jgi:4'-phosphopantetheinyl transferase
MVQQSWLPTPPAAAIRPGEVHIWQVDAEAQIARLELFRRLLADEELQKAARFYFDRDRHTSLVSRGALRALLGYYLACDPRSIRFALGPQGKPALAEPRDVPSPAFNVSHSGRVVLLAFAGAGDVGVDVELLREVPDGPRIVDHYFTPSEVSRIKHTGIDSHAFLRAWTRKEAVIKAVGRGLSMPLNQFDVSCVDPSGAATIDFNDGANEDWQLTVADIPLAEYAAAFAIGGAPTNVACFDVSAFEQVMARLG